MEMSKGLQAILTKYFRKATGKKVVMEKDKGEPMSDADARRAVARLTDRQRAALDEPTLAALADMMADATKHPRRGDPDEEADRLKTFEWFRARKSPDLERSWVTLAVTYDLIGRRGDIDWLYVSKNDSYYWLLRNLAQAIGKRTLKLTSEQVGVALESSRDQTFDGKESFDYAVIEPMLKALHKNRAGITLSSPDAELLARVRDKVQADGYGASSRRDVAVMNEMLGQVDRALLWTGEPWAAAAAAALEKHPANKRAALSALLKHGGEAGTGRPSKAWADECARLVAAAGADVALPWIEACAAAFIADPRERLEAMFNSLDDLRGRFQNNTGYIAGLMHTARALSPERAAGMLGRVAEHVVKFSHGARVQTWPVASAAVRALEAMPGDRGLAELNRLELSVRWPKLRKFAGEALDAALVARGGTRADVEELAAPDLGFADGRATVASGKLSAALEIRSGDRPAFSWTFNGAPITRLTKAIKDAHPETIAAAQALAKDAERAIAGQRRRLDLLFRRPTRWPLADWRQRYLAHGLIGPLARRLIWIVGDVPVLPVGDRLVDVNGKPVKPAKSADVALWHPALRNADEVLAWRRRLESASVTQPFKQAHREVYLLTPAERKTRTYSNRFAGHVVRNHATVATSQSRKWTMGMYGGKAPPTVDLPHFGLTAVWRVDPAGETHDHMGFPLYLTTDRVTFRRADSDEPIPLADVPPLAFSEVMRDVDLFVGVASIGNDPTWQDGGPGGAFRAYWRNYSFGELSATAQTRKAVLESLLPRLTKLKDQWSLADRFLVIRGGLRTYKIHLGSGNILMEPNDQYLCIVPGRGGMSGETVGAGGVFLPFEGDSMMSIILSKAFLLAEDAKIKDSTITSQISRR
jgi:hypothetical protein